MNTRKWLWVLAIAVMVGLVLFLGGGQKLAQYIGGGEAQTVSQTSPELSPDQQQALPEPTPSELTIDEELKRVNVETASAELRQMARQINAVGSLRARDSVMLRAETNGRITEVAFDEGLAVTRGQVLIRLDDSIVKAQLQEAQAKLSLANSQHRRSQQLSQQGFISSQARDEAASQLQVAQASVALAQAQLDKTMIRAPFDGLVGLKNISVGDYLSPGVELIAIEAVDPLEVDFRIPEHYLSEITVGLPIDVRLDAFPGKVYRGEVGAISPVVDATGRSLLLRAQVPNSQMILRPGLFARVTLELGTDEVVMVPESAITPSGGAQYVFKVVNNVVQRIEVSVGLRRDGWVEVVGIDAGDEIVVLGTQKVAEGTVVNVVNQ